MNSVKKKKNNICSLFLSSQVHGIPMKQLPSSYLESISLNSESRIQKHAAKFVLKLKPFCYENAMFDDKSFQEIMEELLHFLDENDRADNKSFHFFNAFGGTKVLLNIIRKTFYNEDLVTNGVISTIPEKFLTPLQITLKTLFYMQGLLRVCQTDYWFQSFLFSLLADKRSKIFDVAAKTLQEINVSDQCQNVIQLKNITCLKTVLRTPMIQRQKVATCNLFSGLLSALDLMANASDSLVKYDRWLLDNDYIKDNQDNRKILADIPEFIKLVVDVSCKVLTTKDLNFFLSDDFLSEEENVQEINESYLEQYPHLSSWYNLLLAQEKYHRPHGFVILCLLLVGKAKVTVLQECLKYDFFKKLRKIANPLVWYSLNHVLPHIAYDDMHNPDVFFKIQYLRLIHTIGDYADNKYYLLTRSELKELREYSETFSCTIPQLNEVDEAKCCDGESGFIVDVLNHLLEAPYESQSGIRFWMARSLESFLRGQPCIADQMLLIRRKLVENLVSSFLSQTELTSDVIQCQFDLLASVMKNCMYAWVRLNAVVDKVEKFKTLKNMIEFNLVDSNMFVRCIILSLHFFSKNQIYTFYNKKCTLLHHYTLFETRIDSICSLVSNLDVKKLTQENISCLNTTLTYLLIAYVNDEIPKYMSAIHTWGDGKYNILHNLESLLNFWIEHYSLSSRESDCKQLQETTGIAIEKLMETVRMLLDKNSMTPSTIAYYLRSKNPNLSFKLPSSGCSRFS